MSSHESEPSFGPSTITAERPEVPASDNPFARRSRRIHFEPEEAQRNMQAAAEVNATRAPEADAPVTVEQAVELPVVADVPAPQQESLATRETTSDAPTDMDDFLGWARNLPQEFTEVNGVPLSSSQLLDLYEQKKSYADLSGRPASEQVSPQEASIALTAEQEVSLEAKTVGKDAALAVEAIIEHVPLQEESLESEDGSATVMMQTGHVGEGLDARFEMNPDDGTVGAVELVVAEQDGQECDIVVVAPESDSPQVLIDEVPATAAEIPIVEAILAHTAEVAREASPAETAEATDDEIDGEAEPTPEAASAELVAEGSTAQTKENPSAEIANGLKLKQDALKYFSTIARQSPRMSGFLQHTVGKIAQERGMSPDDVMKTLNTAQTQPSAEALQALQYLLSERVRSDSQLWNEPASSQSMIGKSVNRYQQAIEVALRGMMSAE